MEKANQMTNEEIKARKRRCWCPNCPHKAFLEDWAGWRWCWRHWLRNLKGKENNKWFYFRTTKLY